MKLSNTIESILFALGEPVTLHELIGLTKESEENVTNALAELKNALTDRGIVFIESNEGYALGTHPDASPILDGIRKDELGKELSKASLETLAIILYQNGATRSDIDFIRGVNSTFILRNLVMRGLIERTEHPDDSRKSYFIPTLDLITHLGVGSVSDLPEFGDIKGMLENKHKGAILETQTVADQPLQ
jgi:segregation and condensation protein B